MGLSYAAHTQLAAAGLNPPGLKAMVLDSGGFDNAYRWGIRQGGAFELKQATWAYKQSRSEEEFDSNEIMEWFQRMPWAEGDRKSTRLNSSHVSISYAVFCLKK